MKSIITLVCLYLIALTLLVNIKSQPEEPVYYTGEQLWERQLAKKKARREKGYAKMDAPEVFQEFHRGIRTPVDQQSPAYSINYRIRELKKAKQKASLARTKANGVLEFKSRGPANVPGRTRGLLVMQTDPTFNTWLAGSAGGGIWKTTDAGETWRNLTPDFPTLAVSTLANSDANPDIIYAGTGEYIASAGTAIEGAGIFKSTDGGETWVQLPATANTNEFISVTRVIVDPENPDLVLACSAPNVWDAEGDFLSTIMRSTDGGNTWSRVFEVTVDDIENGTVGAIEQLIATPGDFNVLYATSHAFGVLKSTDAGQTWFPSNTGMDPYGRIELAISPVKTDRIWASTEGSLAGSDSDLYLSDDAGETWSIVQTELDNLPINFLGGQGWYDNTAACDPYNENIVYYGGVSLFRTVLTEGFSTIYQYSLNEVNTSFLDFVNFGADYANGMLEVGLFADTISVEVRFSPGRSQMAHRYLVPEGATSGVQPEDYYYQDYVEVPFEAWDVTNNRQLMVAFRDQGRDEEFNLIHANTSGNSLDQSREYIYISNINYNASEPDPDMAENGGHEALNMYFFWPVLAQGQTWDPNNLPESVLEINYSGLEQINASTQAVVDVYGEYTGINQFQTFSSDVHPDQHNMIMIPADPENERYRILLSNDGGVFYSNTAQEPGINEGDWRFAGQGYVTSQFYGADRSPVEERYFGGMQDNGTWISPRNVSADESTNYNFKIGGDGFEVLWNYQNPDLLIGGYQYNNFFKSTDGGNTFKNARSGIIGNEPFISKLSNSIYNSDVIYTVTTAGVFRSDNFGDSWNLTPITERWRDVERDGYSPTYFDVEVSRANANIVWAGLAMADNESLHVSTDGGRSFSPVNNYDQQIMGNITRLASHPTEDSTAYAVFSFAKRPKILRTTDLGQSWEDISGYDNAPISSSDFPDVAVYCLYVRPDNPDIIWAGTEIGIVESTDNGASWNLLEEFINASVWDMKGVNDEVVIATHGRGIWTAKMESSQVIYSTPELTDVARTPDGEVIAALSYTTEYDSIDILIDNSFRGNFNPSGSQDTILITGAQTANFEITTIGYRGWAPFRSFEDVSILPERSPIESYFTYFDNASDNNISVNGFTFTNVTNTTNQSLHSSHDYPLNTNIVYRIARPITVSEDNAVITYDDIAIVEPSGNDYVVVEATTNGLNWIPIIERYDASFSSEWLELYNSGEDPTTRDFITHQINLRDFFPAGENIFIRFRLHSDENETAWGWAIDNLFVQSEVVGIDKSQISEVLLFPNPVNEHLTIELNKEKGDITILDIRGKEIFHKQVNATSLNISTSTLKNGTYILVFEHDGGKEVKKFVVQH